jgi:tetratricopeptide (TPR) repeat protein
MTQRAQRRPRAQRRLRRRRWQPLSIALCLCVSAFSASSASSALGQFGTIHFQTSGAAPAQPHFLRGVAALHSFEYEEALDAFRQARAVDPGFAMACWGEAMAHNRTLWGQQDRDAAAAALARLGPTRGARTAKAPTAREKSYLDAVEILFGDGDKATRDAQYAEAMARLAAKYPDDQEAATFYALAKLATVQRGIQGIAAEDGHRHALPGSEVQGVVAAILQKVLKANPEHPGAAHYLIHVWDDREHASLALPVAKTYARIAPAASHARHMPAHVFFHLGLWDAAAASDESAWQASVALAEGKKLPASMRSYHSLSWLQYVYLQQGRYAAADKALGEIEPVAAAARDPVLLAIAASMRARAVVDTARWDRVRGRMKFDNHDELFAIALGASRGGDTATAEMGRQELAQRASAARTGDYRPIVAILEREIAALLRLSARDASGAVSLLKEAAAAEAQLPSPAGPPLVIKPSHELLGEVLSGMGRHQEAAAAFEAALKRYPNRSASVLGLARALAGSGAREGAREQYKRFAANWRRADVDRPELAEARKW